jgi:hypothetical protein
MSRIEAMKGRAVAGAIVFSKSDRAHWPACAADPTTDGAERNDSNTANSHSSNPLAKRASFAHAARVWYWSASPVPSDVRRKTSRVSDGLSDQAKTLISRTLIRIGL